MKAEQMVRRFNENKLVIASHNAGKVTEIGELLAPFGVQTLSAAELSLPEPDETGRTFEENAELKALAAATASGLPALADDSGLSVDALDGQPGIYSARWGGSDRDFALAMARVNTELAAFENRQGSFICALSLAWPDNHVETFRGRVVGEIVWPPRGDKGFGYDPIFQASGYEITFGEMVPGAKHEISHRADAFQQLVDHCFK